MLHKSPSKPAKPVKFLDTKVFIVTLSTAVTIGLWNLFSNNALEVEKVQAKTVPPPDQANSETQDAASLPTLIPLMEVSTPQSNPGVDTRKDQVGQPTSLRSVTAPTQVVVQKVKPIVDSGVVVPVASGGGGGGNQPIAKTRSSR